MAKIQDALRFYELNGSFYAYNPDVRPAVDAGIVNPEVEELFSKELFEERFIDALRTRLREPQIIRTTAISDEKLDELIDIVDHPTHLLVPADLEGSLSYDDALSILYGPSTLDSIYAISAHHCVGFKADNLLGLAIFHDRAASRLIFR